MRSAEDWANGVYEVVGVLLQIVASLVIFFGGWIWCTLTYGFLLGFGLGWLPSLIAASIVGAILRYGWPLLLFLAAVAWGLAAS